MNALSVPKTPWHLRAARRAVSPALFDFWATRVNPLWTLEQPMGRLVSRTQASRDAVTLVIRPNRHWAGMLPGQHVNLGIEIEGRRLVRSYSPTPMGDGTFAITVKTMDGGVVSGHLARDARIGEVFVLDQAFGEMILPATATDDLLLLAAGSGITPMRALLRALAAQGMPVNVNLLYWARHRDEFCFVDELEALAAAHPRLRVRTLATRDGAQPDPRIDTVSLDAIAGLSARRVLACGPGGFVQSARARLAEQVARFDAEAFSAPDNVEGEEGEVQVRLSRSGRTLTLARGTSLLEGLEAQGIRPRHGCRMGICNTCVCGRQSGTTRHTLTGERSGEPSSQVRLCVSAPSTDLVLDL